MKIYEKSSQRFVKEYANWKVSILKDLAKSHPDEDRAEQLNGRAIYIERMYNRWKDGMVTTNEVMALIAKA